MWKSIAPFQHSVFKISNRVHQALRSGKPVVALESTIITHGMPFPENLQTAIQVENIVKENGCIPATIALMDGIVKVGLEEEEMERLAMVGLKAHKTSRRDMALAIAQKRIGATTVSGTMVAAHYAGIKVFVTGGIGGVHRGAETSFDISADLTELGRTPITVVCAGVKSILDIEKTLEYLETQGVTTITYGNDKEFPAFYTRKSGFQAMCSINSAEDCAKVIRANTELGLKSGIVVGVPIPKEHEYPDPKALEKTIQEALLESKHLGIKGKDATPFLLDKVKALTGGHSLRANIELIKNNARVGSLIACALYPKDHTSNRRPFVVGGTVVDISAKVDAAHHSNNVLKLSTPGTVFKSLGGVGRNIAEACHLVGGEPLLISAVGDDMDGAGVISKLQERNMDISGIEVLSNSTTPVYNALLHADGELIAAVGDMRLHEQMRGYHFDRHTKNCKPSIVCVDGNVNMDYLEHICNYCTKHEIPILFEPTSVFKSAKIFKMNPGLLKAVKFITPDIYEATTMKSLCDKLESSPTLDDFKEHLVPELESETDCLIHLLQVFENVVLKCGRKGVLVGTSRPKGASEQTRCIIVGDLQLEITRLKANLVKAVSVTGAGDSMVGVITAGVSKVPYNALNHENLVHVVRCGMKAAELTVKSPLSVSPSISPSILDYLYNILLPNGVFRMCVFENRINQHLLHHSLYRQFNHGIIIKIHFFQRWNVTNGSIQTWFYCWGHKPTLPYKTVKLNYQFL